MSSDSLDTAKGLRLVVTMALRKEVPREWLESRGVPVLTLKALKAGALSSVDGSARGVLVIITGAGPEASEEAAWWIRDNLEPLFVLNIGTCGAVDRRLPPGEWIVPRSVSNEEGETLELDTRLPVPCANVLNPSVSSPPNEGVALLTVRKEVTEHLPNQWRQYDAVDMECHAQARVFRDVPFTFHCLKFTTDHCDGHTVEDFNRNLEVFREEVKGLFRFVEDVPVASNPSGPVPVKVGLKVTAVIPVYNREHTIRRAIDSVLAQTCPPEETIVVDDGSTDGTRDVLEGYGNRITTVLLPENYGPSRARNEGLKRARTEWVAFLDSDDEWERDKLERQVEYLYRYPFFEIMQSDEKWIRKGRRVNPCRYHQKPEGWIWERSLERCLISPSAVLAKKSLLEAYGGFDESYPVCEDYDLWLRISRRHPVGLDRNPAVIKYGGHDDQLSRSVPVQDRYRVRTLYRLFQDEQSPEFRKKIIPVLEKKLHILINGYEKRDKVKDAEECRRMLDEVRRGYYSEVRIP